MEIEFSGHHEKSSYFKAISWIYKPSKRKMLIRIIAFVVFAGIFGAYLFLSFKEGSFAASGIARILRSSVTFLILAVVIFIPYINGYRTASTLWADPLIRRKMTGRVSGLGIQIDPSKDWMEWDKFVKIFKDETLVVLLTAARLFVILPRQFFQSDQDWSNLQDLVSSKVQEVIE